MANFLNLLGPLLLGVAVAGVLLFAKRVLRVPLPGWLVPTAAAVAIMGGHLYNEYTWYDRFTERLPARFTVVDTATTQGLLEPWTYLWPRINRFAAIDSGSIKTNANSPDLVMGKILLFQRYAPTAQVSEVVDCAGNRAAALSPQTEFAADGMPQNVDWEPRAADHPIMTAMCAQRQG